MHEKNRFGYSLLELVAVLALLGIISAAATVRLASKSMGNLGAKADARGLALDLMQARRRAIATGNNHFIEFQQESGKIVGYTVRQRLEGGGTEAVEPPRRFAEDITATVSPSSPEFTFEGEALAGYTITLAAPDRTWQVTVAQATGAVQVAE